MSVSKTNVNLGLIATICGGNLVKAPVMANSTLTIRMTLVSLAPPKKKKTVDGHTN